MKVVTARHGVGSWFEKNDIYVKGYLFVYNEIFRGDKLVNYVTSMFNSGAIDDFISKANGSFVIIANNSNYQKIALVDRLRSIPLFYAYSGSEWVVGDDAEIIRRTANVSMKSDKMCLKEFVMAGFVVGANTLIKGLYQIRAGEKISFKENGQILRSYYYLHRAKVRKLRDEEEEYDCLDFISNNIGNRLISSADSRCLALPLSGGYDSRYIASILRKKNFNNIISYTYGRHNSPEVTRSRLVAHKLNIPWFFVEYTEKKFKKFFSDGHHDKYCNFAHQHSSLPHYQEFIAIQELLDTGILDSNAIIVPGFCGDIFGGSYVPREVNLGLKEKLLEKGIVNHIYDQQFYLKLFLRDRFPTDVGDHIALEIERIDALPCSIQDFVSLNDAFFILHKVAKYIIHSLRVYEYFKLEWRMPLWDNELTDYWYQVPYEYRSNINLYESYLFDRHFKPLGIDVPRPPGGGVKRFHTVLSIFPFPYRKADFLERVMLRVVSYVKKNDPNAFDVLEDIYSKYLTDEGMGYFKAINFIQLFSRWFIWHYYKSDLAFKPIR
ncbi:asparagine synthase [bacterium]|nr:asparagine synthase [bacterium]